MKLLKLLSPVFLLPFLLVSQGCQYNQQEPSGEMKESGFYNSAELDSYIDNQGTETGENRKRSDLNNFTDWSTYRGDKKGTHYSKLDQITTGNVQKLEEVWSYDTKGPVRPGMESNPIVIDGTMYFADSKLNLVALDARTGQKEWLFDPSEKYPSGDSLEPGIMRGEVYWEDEQGNNERIFHITNDLVWAVDPEDGSLVESFGKGGYIDLKENHVWDAEKLDGRINNSSPAVTYKDHLIMDSNVWEGRTAPPGNIRSFNAMTGEHEWTLHTIPREEGQLGHDTWEWEEDMIYGGANSWGGFTVDEERGWVFAATGSATGGIHGGGGARPGKNLFANSVLAIDASTGELQWHYQINPHDIWDYDIGPAPMLTTITKDGEERDVVFQVGKQGLIFVLDRDTGKSLFPVAKKPVPTDAAPGEDPYPTQPWPLKPDPLVRTEFHRSDLTNITPKSHEAALEQFRKLDSGNMYTPPSTNGTIVQPGIHGGAEWGGPGYDPETNTAYVNVNDFPFVLTLDPMQPDQFKNMTAVERGKATYNAQCAACHGSNRMGGTGPSLADLTLSSDSIRTILAQGRNAMPAFPHLSDDELGDLVNFLQSDINGSSESKNGVAENNFDLDNENLTWSGGDKDTTWSTSTPQYVAQLDYFTDHMGYHAIKPPWGKLVAVDVAEGRVKWSVPLGEYPKLADSLGVENTGAENFGGMAVTKGGLVFIAATEDNMFRAFNKSNGDLLWEFEMEAPGFSSPSTYKIDGKQYVVIVAGGGGGRYRSPVSKGIGGTVHTFALPDSKND